MSDPIYLVQGDTAPQIKATLTRSDTGTAQDLTSTTVNMHFRKALTTTLLFSVTGTHTGVSAAAGEVVFNFTAGQLNLDAGHYEGEIEVVFASGVRETVFETLNFMLREDFA
jgi:hypothetical protein